MPNPISPKPQSALDANQVLKSIYNPADNSISTNGFVVAQINNQITRTLVNSTTENYAFNDGPTGDLLYTIQIVYTDSTLGTISTVTRIN